MVYGYGTNKEFIDKSYQLLEKLDKKSLWNKDTLIIGLDKSVRPLAYTLRKLSKEEKRDTPDIRFFNYSHYDFMTIDKKEINKEILKRFDPNKLRDFDNIIILDEYIHSGKTLEGVEKILNSILEVNEKEKLPKPKITKAALIYSPSEFSSKKDYVVVDKKGYAFNPKESNFNTGVEDKYPATWISHFQESTRTDESHYYFFAKNRKKLKSDIEHYVNKIHPKTKVQKIYNKLEKILSKVFVFVFFIGLLFGSTKLTGNIIGNLENVSGNLGLILIVIGAFGFFISKKLSRE